MTGDEGEDTFVIEDADHDHAITITDFDPDEDALVLNYPDGIPAIDTDDIVLVQNGGATEVYVEIAGDTFLLADLPGVTATDIDPTSIAITSLDEAGLEALVP